MKFGIANPCCRCGTLTKNVKWIKGQQKPICKNCEKKELNIK